MTPPIQTLAPGLLPPGLRIYAVGDVHGCAHRLGRLHAAIAADAASRPAPSCRLIHLGDYIDRGPDSAGVIGRLLGPPPLPGAEVVNLMGNHEHMLLSALDGGDNAEMAWLWLENGGRASLRSWGVPESAGPAGWRRLIPAAHLAFLRGLAQRHTAGSYLFVHAGVRPGVPLDAQSGHDLLWIREPFLSWVGDFGAVVVHGHTPRPEVEVRANRIGLDTGAVMGGLLTCAVLEGDRLRFLTA